MSLHKEALTALLSQGSLKESWEVGKVHAGTVVQNSSKAPSVRGRSPQPRGCNHRKREGPRCTAAGEERLRRSCPRGRSGSGVLCPLRPSFRVPGYQPPQVPLPSYVRVQGRNLHSNPFSGAGCETLNGSFSGIGIKRERGQRQAQVTQKLPEGCGNSRRWAVQRGEPSSYPLEKRYW